MIRVLIGGDIYPDAASAERLRKGEIRGVLGGLVETLGAADLVIANLEGPLIDRPSPTVKIGPHHGFPGACVQGLAAAGIRWLNLANNHAMDHGEAGLLATLRWCREHGVRTLGAGMNLAEAGQPLVVPVQGLRVGFLSYTEHEFGVAGSGRPGTNPIDVMHFVRAVQAGKARWDVLVVLVHGGNEYHPFPRPAQRDLGRFMCEQGAAVVVFQHSHCAGCWEQHAGGVVIHGQGNFIFDTRGANPCEMEGFLVALDIDGPGRVRWEAIPYRQEASGGGPRPLEGGNRDAFLGALQGRSAAMEAPGYVEARWEEFVRSTPYNYLALLQGYPRRLRELDLKFGILGRFYSTDRLRMLLHLLRCESHREASIAALGLALQGRNETEN